MSTVRELDALRCCLESPVDGQQCEGAVVFRGWCLALDGSAPSLRARIGGSVSSIARSIARADVAAAFTGSDPQAHLGFELDVNVAAGEHEAVLEVERQGQWTVLDSRRVWVAAAKLRAALETPQGVQCTEGLVRVSGWCFFPERSIVELRVAVGADVARAQHGMARADVAAAFPHGSTAFGSGFEATIAVRPGRWPVELRAILEDGSVAELRLQTLHCTPRPLLTRIKQRVRSAWALVRFGANGLLAWVREQGRVPWPWELPGLLRFGLERFASMQTQRPLGLPAGFEIPEICEPYDAWIRVNRTTPRSKLERQSRLAKLATQPHFSVVMPVYRPPLDLLRAAVNSVLAQQYAAWELCIADDASGDPDLSAYLKELQGRHPQVRVMSRATNGNISAATNDAATLARGEFLVFVDQDDLLTPEALAELALAIHVHPNADLVYSDDDKIDATGRRFAPQFKPDWSPELLLGFMYLSHVVCLRRSLFVELGGARLGFEGSQDFDLALRASEHARQIVHVPRVLYHWRVLPGSTAASGREKPASFEAGRRAVQEAYARRGIVARAIQPDWASRAGVGIFCAEFPDAGPKVSIVIPTRNGLQILRRCIESLAKTAYRNYELLIVDNGSDDPATLGWLAQQPHRVERIDNPAGRFNYAYINNRAVERVDGEFVLFLNNDTEVIDAKWLSQMVGYARISGVGAVGARLLYPDRRIQHAGIVHGYYRGMAGPAFKLAPEWDGGYMSQALVTRNCLAATAACLLTPRTLFLSVGGFDEVQFEVAYNDVDYCYRLHDSGQRIVCCAEAVLLHHEGLSRGFVDRPQEIAAFRRLHGSRVDPYYNPNLSLDDERYRVQPRVQANPPERPVRALMCAFNLNLEGAPHSQLELTLGLKQRGAIDPVVYCPSDGPLRARYEAAGVPVHVFPHPLTDVFDRPAFERALDQFGTFARQLDVDLIYGNTLQTFYAIAAAQRAGIPCVWNPRESEPWQTYFDFLPAALVAPALACFRYPYRVVFVAEATRKAWSLLDTSRNFAVIHNGLNISHIESAMHSVDRSAIRASLGVAAEELVVLLPGTVCERKGQRELIAAIAALPKSCVQRARFWVVGDRASEYSLSLHADVRALPGGTADRVTIVPETREIARYYAAADIFACTSRVESFPRVVLEAMAHALPIISTDVFGVVEQVMPGVNARLYPPGGVADLAAHLAELLTDDVLRRRFASNSRAVLESLTSFDAMVSSYETVFLEAALSSPICDTTSGPVVLDRQPNLERAA